ncbi:MAG: hypothetical protein WC107_07455 [Patescibacteria group bacterium]
MYGDDDSNTPIGRRLGGGIADRSVDHPRLAGTERKKIVDKTEITKAAKRLSDAFATMLELIGIMQDNDPDAFTEEQADDFSKAAGIVERHVKNYCTPKPRPVTTWADVKKALEAIPDTDATTTPFFWDCECDVNYIHDTDTEQCHKCHARLLDDPAPTDSRLREVMLLLMEEAGI